MNTTLLIMAAGIGSRFAAGIKQLQPIGPNGEIIMDYSIHDAIQAGFNKIIFIIRRDIEEDFRNVFGNRIEIICKQLNIDVGYAFQDLDAIPKGYEVPKGRIKPWGTGQAILVAKELIQEPFVVINADDYYGKDSFTKVYDFLTNHTPESANVLCMVGFLLKNTLSDYGSVTRGVCQVNNNLSLVRINEICNIIKTSNGVFTNNQRIDRNAYVSMNMWGLTPMFFKYLEDGFLTFLQNMDENKQEAEFLLPNFIDSLLVQQQVTVQVLKTEDKWIGLTYQEDISGVKKKLLKLYEKGEYNRNLFCDVR